MLRILGAVCCLLFGVAARTNQEGQAAWNRLKRQPISEQTFRAACDLMQKTGRTNINRSY